MANIAQLTTDTFQDSIAETTPTLVDFWAEWCAPCRAVAPILEEIAAEKEGSLKVVKLNVDENPDTARSYRVMSIPTLMVFQGGDEKKRIVGARGKSQLLSEVEPFIA